MISQIDIEANRAVIADWLSRHIAGATDMTIGAIDRPAIGNSAETIFITADYMLDGKPQSSPLVLRRRVEGHDLSLETDFAGEFRVLETLARHPAARAPAVVGLELGREVMGAPFYVMNRVEGRAVHQYPNYNSHGWLAESAPEFRREAWHNALRQLAAIHTIDWRNGFGFLNRYAERPGLDQHLGHLERWYRWALKDRTHPYGEAALDYLRRNQPATGQISLLWGDAIPANMLFDADGQVSAVIDWELASLGPGEIDLGWWLYFDDLFSSLSGVERLAHLPSRAATIAIYEEAAGRRLADMAYFELLANFRLSIIAIRQADRQVAFGAIAPQSRAWIDNPVNSSLADRLEIARPEVGEDFVAMQVARKQTTA